MTFLFCTALSVNTSGFFFDHRIKVVCALVNFEKYLYMKLVMNQFIAIELTKLCSVHVIIQAFMHLHRVTVAICRAPSHASSVQPIPNIFICRIGASFIF